MCLHLTTCLKPLTVNQLSTDGVTLGHMPREVSKVSILLRCGISCEITGRRKRSAVPRKGLEVVSTLSLENQLHH